MRGNVPVEDHDIPKLRIGWRATEIGCAKPAILTKPTSKRHESLKIHPIGATRIAQLVLVSERIGPDNLGKAPDFRRVHV
jgi:hypothetical protein